MVTPIAVVVLSKADEIPALIRPTRELAIEIAEAFFRRGLRVDMQVVAEKLGIARTTLYRWVGGREQLIAEVLARLGARVWDFVEENVEGQGLERVLQSIEAFMTLTASYPPLREFAQREPQLALRLLLERDGPVTNGIAAGVVRGLRQNVPDFDENANQELLDTCVQIGTALEYAPIAIGEEPSIDRAMRLIRGMFQTYQRRQSG